MAWTPQERELYVTCKFSFARYFELPSSAVAVVGHCVLSDLLRLSVDLTKKKGKKIFMGKGKNVI